MKVSDIQDVLSYTKIKCLWDELGKNEWIVYPRAYSTSSISKVETLLNTDQLGAIIQVRYGMSGTYKRQLDVFIEMIKAEFDLGLVSK